jgi:hypothetical protein
VATPPKRFNLSREDIPDAPEWFGKYLEAANPVLSSANTALTNNLTLADNLKCEVKSFSFTAPSLVWRAPTFQNSWANFDTTAWQPAGYRIDTDGFVRIRGHVATGAVGSTIFTLPTGFRPALNEQFSCMANNAWGLITVAPSGAVTLTAGTGTPFVSIAGITFQAASPAAPDAPGGAFPLSLSHSLGSVAMLQVGATQCTSLAAGTIRGAPVFEWENGTGAVLVRNVYGLVPGQNYKCSVYLFGG